MPVAIIIPCFRVSRHIGEVLDTIPDHIDRIVVVDDCCPENSGDVAAAKAATDGRIKVVRHDVNQGVGAAMATGYRAAAELGCDVLVKMDGDGQMDPAYLPQLIAPVQEGRALYAKGNRFRRFDALRSMPPARLFGNSVLSFLVKAASGQWGVMDPTNGYTALHASVLNEIEPEKLHARYFFESDMLIALGIAGHAVIDVAMPARYGDETSSLSIRRAAAEFPFLLAKRFIKRVFVRYFLADFNIGSLYLTAAALLLPPGLVFGLSEWIASIATGTPRSAGTVMLAGMPIILGMQFLLQAVAYDISASPKPKD